MAERHIHPCMQFFTSAWLDGCFQVGSHEVMHLMSNNGTKPMIVMGLVMVHQEKLNQQDVKSFWGCNLHNTGLALQIHKAWLVVVLDRYADLFCCSTLSL